MASGSPAPSNATSGTATVAPSAHANYIEEKLEKTGTDVQVVEVSTAILKMLVLVLVYLLTMVIVDQWLVPEGLGSGIRACALVLLLGYLVFYAIRNLLPHLLYRVNPAFAALTIERSEPSLKNSVLNFLLVRHKSRNVPGVVIRGMEKQAATGLAGVSVDSVVDHRQLIQGGIVFVATILFCGLYMVFSPKNMLPTVGRLLVPWADIEPVRRIRIEHVHPGNSSVLSRSHVTVSAEVHGLRDGEMVFLVYSSRSGGAVDQPIQMFRAANETAYSCQLPESEGGLVSDVQYRIEAGDCVSQTYQLDLITAPSLQVQKIEYHYPSYTGLESRSVESVGDIKAIEGSRVVIHAEANQDIVSAAVILERDHTVEGDRTATRPMVLKDRLAKCQLLLERHIVRQQSIPEFTGYHLHLATPSGAVNQNAIQHRIAITRDQSPIVEILRPEESFVDVPENGDLFFQVRARDPDFRIAELFLVGRLDDQTLFEEDLIKHHKAGGEALEAAYREVFRFLPKSYQLVPGQRIQVVVRATDNKRPEPNVVFSKPVEIRITAADENFSSDPENNREPSGADDRKGESQGSGASSGGQGGGDESSGDETGDETSKQGGQGGNNKRSEQGAGKGAADEPDDQTGSQEQQAGGSQETGGQSGHPNSNNTESGTRGAMENSDQGGSGNPSASSEPGNESEGKVDNDGDAFQHLSEKIHEEKSQEHKHHGDSNGAASDNEGDGSGAENDGQQQNGSETAASQDGNNSPHASKGGPGSERSGSKENSGREKRRQGEGQSQGEPSSRDKNQSPSEGDSDAGAKSSREEGGGTGNAGEQPPSPPEGAGEKRRRSGKQNRSGQDDKEPADSGVSNHESDSAEGKEGSRHGKGEEGGGQQSSQSGEGAGGSHTPAPSGKGAAKESGFGESGDRAGESGLTDEATGNHTAERGDAAEGNPEGDLPQEQSSSSERGEGGGSEGSDGHEASKNQSEGPVPQDSQQDGQPGTGSTEGKSALGGKASRDNPDVEDGPVVEPGADAPNLEYARETTALVLDYLQDQLDRGGIDPELKKKFGWTDEEFVDFVNRYRHLMRKTQQSGDEGRRAAAEWEAALRSLGLKQPGQALREGNMRAKKARGLQEINRSRPPQAEQERFDAFRKDILSR